MRPQETERNSGLRFTPRHYDQFGYNDERYLDSEHEDWYDQRLSARSSRGWDRSGLRSSNPGMREFDPYYDIRPRDFNYANNYEREAARDAFLNMEPNHYGKGPKGYRRPDERIREDVCDLLLHSYAVDASNIDVKVKDGCVTLSGTVDSRLAKRTAEVCSERVRGVEDIQNELKIARTDETSINRGQKLV